uniref:Uncharacterized protein n=1 Tax=Anguilla anguilla TaxID=7936 RepID=A0A0E9PDC6_ANGAN
MLHPSCYSPVLFVEEHKVKCLKCYLYIKLRFHCAQVLRNMHRLNGQSCLYFDTH